MKCPYCAEKVGKRNIIDSGHLDISNFKRKRNTRNIYLCPACTEVFEAFQKDERLLKPVDRYFERKFQYCSKNIEKAEYWKF